MPSSVSTLLTVAGLDWLGTVAWGEPVSVAEPGVYLVALSSDPQFLPATALEAPISSGAVRQLLDARPELTLDGQRPTPAALVERLGSFWLLDEAVVYVGLAGTSLRNRVSQYYRTRLGARKPHAGGWFLKTLSILPELHVHFAAAEDPRASEDTLIEAFVGGLSPASIAAVRDPLHAFPFANLEWPKGVRKDHGIKGATEPRL